jgi:hypothetical protein
VLIISSLDVDLYCFSSIDTNDIMALSDTAVQSHLMHVLLLRC